MALEGVRTGDLIGDPGPVGRGIAPSHSRARATLMAEHGPAHGVGLKDVSATLGHSTTAITADLYPHVTTGMRRRVANAAEAIVGRRETSN
jgi:hypothetical protein